MVAGWDRFLEGTHRVFIFFGKLTNNVFNFLTYIVCCVEWAGAQIGFRITFLS